MKKLNRKMFLRVDMTLKMVGKVEESLLCFFKGETFSKRDKKVRRLCFSECGLDTPFTI